ncbi:Abi family protein [Schaalia vaccimaxillae]|uniref:Abi family protein n=1 Tax=Schaalia vaccimaxillae TaxID=183916 RepID=UPI0003B53D18|nr:Abi family protein [Schaalia vaccimaxillae]
MFHSEASTLTSTCPKDHSTPDKTGRIGRDPYDTLLEAWKATVDEGVHNAREKDAVAHHLIKYGEPVPIWTALDVLSFGSLPYFMDLLHDDDLNTVARNFGIKHGASLTKWTRAFVDLRNICAHGQRLFNSTTKRQLKIRSNALVAPDVLGHLADSAPQKRVYTPFTLLAYMLTQHPLGSFWPRDLRTQIRKFPKTITEGSGSTLTIESMGFPLDWETLLPWTHA